MHCEDFAAQPPVVLTGGQDVLDPIMPQSFDVLSPITLTAGTPQAAAVWTGYGPPTLVIGSQPGDEYLDLISGDLYQLN